MKNMIARRELQPGSPLILRDLASRLKVSRMPIVESIRRLERDGLVTVLPKWGATVKEWSREERLEAYVIRRALEGEAARFFVMRANPEDKRRLVELSDRFDEFAAYDPVQCDEADIEFHLHIVRSTRFQRLYDLIENSKIETATLFGLCMEAVDTHGKRELDYKKLIGCHKPVIDALLGKNPDMAAQAIWHHIDSVLAVLMTLEEEVGESYPKPPTEEPSAITSR